MKINQQWFLTYITLVFILNSCTVDMPQMQAITPSPISPLTQENTPIWTSATSTPITITQEMRSRRNCITHPQQFNVYEALEMSVLQLHFETEEKLHFIGWGKGPISTLVPQTPEPTPDMRPGLPISTQRFIKGGELNLTQAQFAFRDLTIDPLLNNPCGEECPLDIISQSPNNKWQLIQIHDWLTEKSGIWLVGQDEVIRLVPYITDLDWQWAADSSLLWLIYADPQLGSHTTVVYLDSPIITKTTGPMDETLPYTLDPWQYIVAFSPTEKTVLSTTSFEFPSNDTDELLLLDLNMPTIRTRTLAHIPGIVTVRWDQGLQQFLLEVVQDTGIEIQDIFGKVLVSIPRPILEIFHTMSIPNKEVISDLVEPSFRIGAYALSPSGEKLAVIQGENILVFTCTTAE